MLNKRLNILRRACWVMLFAVLVAWLTSYLGFGSWYNGRDFAIILDPGSFRFGRSESTHRLSPGFDLYFFSWEFRTWRDLAPSLWPWLRGPRGWVVEVCFYQIAVLLLAVIVLTRWRAKAKVRRARLRGECIGCGYDRKGLDPSALCPECGKEPRSSG